MISQYINRSAQHKQARLVLIRGEPGIGKSCLLRASAALAREAGAGLLKATAFESDMIRPFGLWNDALRRALPDNPTSTLLGCGEPVSRDAIFNSLCDVLQEACTHRPVVVLCDDMQWADESSVSAVNHVLRMNRKQPLLVIATGRDIELRDNGAVQRVLRSLRHDKLLDEICLATLSADDIRELITTSAPGADAESLSRNCAGNPLLALELAQAGLDGGSANSLSELVRDRLSRLQPDAETLLLWAAVVSPRIAVDSLQRVTGLAAETIETALEAAVQQGMLQPGERGLRFSHDLIASSIYAEIPPARRQHMHRRVAEQLEIETGVELSLAADLSHHARRSGDPALACRAMVSAGKLCLRFYANDDALELYRQGMGFAEQLGDAERVCASLLLCEIRLMSATKNDWET